MTEVTHSYTQSNELIQSCYKMTLNEKRLLILGVSQLNPKDSYLDLDRANPIKIKVTSEDWMAMYGDDSRNAYRDMRQAAKKIFKRSIVLHPRAGVEREFVWFDEAEYDDNKDEVTLQFGHSAAVRLIGMDGDFTSVKLLAVNKLRKASAIRLYEIAKNIYDLKGIGEWLIEDFRHAMDCQDKYPNINELKRCVIRPAIEEVNLQTDLRVEIEYIKTKRQISRLRFRVFRNEQIDIFANQP
jgi:plasmid replication initiation protein